MSPCSDTERTSVKAGRQAPLRAGGGCFTVINTAGRHVPDAASVWRSFGEQPNGAAGKGCRTPWHRWKAVRAKDGLQGRTELVPERQAGEPHTAVRTLGRSEPVGSGPTCQAGRRQMTGGQHGFLSWAGGLVTTAAPGSLRARQRPGLRHRKV